MATPRKSRRKSRGGESEPTFRLSPQGFQVLLMNRSEADQQKIREVFAGFSEQRKSGTPKKWERLRFRDASELKFLFETKGGGFHYEKTLTFKQFQRAHRDAKRDYKRRMNKIRVEIYALLAEMDAHDPARAKMDALLAEMDAHDENAA